MASLRTLRFLAAGAVCALATLAAPALAQDAAPSGEAIFALCTQCHGSVGQGNLAVVAPPIAGMDEWYVAKQLRKYQTGDRGKHAADHEGLKMRPMVRFLKTDAWVDNVSAYVASLPKHVPEPTLVGGDAERGKGLYGPCAACHGPAGQGVEATNGAPLTGLTDWYLYSSLEKFKAGIRGYDPEGSVMRGMAMILADDQAMKDVIAHIMTFTN